MQAVPCEHSSFDLIKYLQEEDMDYRSSLTELSNIRSITIHNKQGETPALFVPLKGEKSDGHMYLHDFLKSHPENVALCGEHFKSNIDAQLIPRVIFVRDTLKGLQALARGYRKTLDLELAGITGSSGKTTFKYLLHSILKQKIDVFASPGNLNNHIGLPLSVLSIPKETSIALIEIGMNHLGEIGDLCQISIPNIGIVVNVGPAHIGFFDSIEEIASAKAELYTYVHRQDGVNYGLMKYRRLFAPRIQKCVKWVEDDMIISGIRFQAPDKLSNGQLRMSLFDLGITPESNTLAMGIANQYGITSKEYWEGLKEFLALDKGLRGSLYRSGKHVIFLDCYNANPDSFSYSLQRASYFAKHFGTKSFVGWYGDMRELGKLAPQYHLQVVKHLMSTQFPQDDVKMRFFGKHFKNILLKEHEKPFAREFKADVDVIDSTVGAEDTLTAMLEKDQPTFFHVKGSRLYQLEDVFQKLLPCEENLLSK